MRPHNVNGDNQVPLPERPELQEKTDYTRWRLLDEAGRQTWHYLEDDEAAKDWPQSVADKHFLGLPLVGPPPPHCRNYQHNDLV